MLLLDVNPFMQCIHLTAPPVSCKTTQAIACMAAFREEWPCLLVVPSSLREVWADALVEWLGVTERDMLLVGAARDLERLRGRRPGAPLGVGFVIVSYALVGKLAAALAGAPPPQPSLGRVQDPRRGAKLHVPAASPACLPLAHDGDCQVVIF